MDLKEEIKIIKNMDFIIDRNPELKKASEKVLKILMKKINVKRGAILFYNQNFNSFELLAERGELDKKIIYAAYRNKKIINKRKEIALPIILGKSNMGVIFLAGKKFEKKDIEYIEDSELILDGRFGYEYDIKGLKGIFGRYVDEKIMKKIMNQSDERHIKGERHDCTIIFADITNFIQYYNAHKPEKVITVLNDFFEEMAEIILKRDGTIDKFIGDEIMAVFGSPIPQKNHALKAVQTAIEMVKKMNYITRKYKISDSGLAVGIATGRVIAGNVGSEKMMNYTVMGKKVNLASRLTSIAGKNEILLDKRTIDDLKNRFKYEKISKKYIKGLGKVDIYKIIR